MMITKAILYCILLVATQSALIAQATRPIEVATGTFTELSSIGQNVTIAADNTLAFIGTEGPWTDEFVTVVRPGNIYELYGNALAVSAQFGATLAMSDSLGLHTAWRDGAGNTYSTIYYLEKQPSSASWLPVLDSTTFGVQSVDDVFLSMNNHGQYNSMWVDAFSVRRFSRRESSIANDVEVSIYPLPWQVNPPYLADNGREIFRSQPASIISPPPDWYVLPGGSTWVDEIEVVASTQVGGFASVGAKPTFSDDGQVAVFIGDRGAGDQVFLARNLSTANPPLDWTQWPVTMPGEFSSLERDDRVVVQELDGATSSGPSRYEIFWHGTKAATGVRGIYSRIGSSDVVVGGFTALQDIDVLLFGQILDVDAANGQHTAPMLDFNLWDAPTRDRSVALWALDFNGDQYALRSRSMLEALDINSPQFRDGNGQPTTAPEVLAHGGRAVKGVVADGVTRLLLRMEVSEPGSMEFQINNLPGDSSLGTLRAIGASGGGSVLTVNSELTPHGEYCFAEYEAPEGIVYPLEAELHIEFAAEFTPYSGGVSLSESVALRLVRPPVVLSHGAFGNRNRWGNFLSDDPRFPLVHYAHWPEGSGLGLAANRDTARRVSERALRRARDAGFAATQVDWVAFSYAALVLRYGVSQGLYRYDDNYDEGFVNRLVTVGGPHFGTRLAASANALVLFATTAGQYDLVEWIENAPGEEAGDFVNGSFLWDLTPGSNAIQKIGVTHIPGRPIVGTGGPTMPGAGVQPGADNARDRFIYELVDDILGELGGGQGYNVLNDLVVTAFSAGGGMPLATHQDLFPLLHHQLPGGQGPQAAVISALLSSVDLMLQSWIAPLLTDQLMTLPPNLNYAAGDIQYSTPMDGATAVAGTGVFLQATTIGTATPSKVWFVTPFAWLSASAPSYAEFYQWPVDVVGTWELLIASADSSSGRLSIGGAISVSVIPPSGVNLLRLEVEQSYLRLMEGRPHRLEVWAIYDDNVRRRIGSPVLDMTFSSSNPQVATVSARGLVSPVASGRAYVTANFQGMSVALPVIVEDEAARTYGYGIAGSGGIVPDIQASGEPFVGNAAFGVQMNDIIGGANGVLFWTVRGPAQFQLASGLPIWIDLLSVPPVQVNVTADGNPQSPGAGSAFAPMPVPASTSAIGLGVYAQAIFFDLASSVPPFSSTRGLFFSIVP